MRDYEQMGKKIRLIIKQFRKKLNIFLTFISFFAITLGLLTYQNSKTIALPAYIASDDDFYMMTCIDSKDEKKRIYLNYDNDEYVTEVMYETIEEVSDKKALKKLDSYTEEVDLYNSVYGIKANVKLFNNTIVKTITYDLKKIKLFQLQNDLKGTLSKKSIFMKSDKLPISFLDFRDIELFNYECSLD